MLRIDSEHTFDLPKSMVKGEKHIMEREVGWRESVQDCIRFFSNSLKKEGVAEELGLDEETLEKVAKDSERFLNKIDRPEVVSEEDRVLIESAIAFTAEQATKSIKALNVKICLARNDKGIPDSEYPALDEELNIDKFAWIRKLDKARYAWSSLQEVQNLDISRLREHQNLN